MSPTINWFVTGALAWLIGSVPFSLLIARWVKGIDLRQHGSGNVGATNVGRVVGKKWGIVALLLDALKGALPALLLPRLLPVSEQAVVHQEVLCGTLAILGHMYPPWIGFRGGKGVATGLGVAAVLSPWATLIAFLIFAVTFALTRIVSASSMIAALAFAIAQVILWGTELWTPQHWSLGLFSIAVPLLIVVRHRGNLRRLWHGEEKRFGTP